MFRYLQATVLCLILFSLTACEEPTRSTGPKAKPLSEPTSTPTTPTPTTSAPAKPVTLNPVPVKSPSPPPSPSIFPTIPKTSTASMPIVLQVGVALPQTGPEGTMMGFSVDYKFVQGEPKDTKYVWVIERSKGESYKLPVEMKNNGNLSKILEKWKPEDGPFHSHIEDKNGNRLSDSIEMK